MIESGAKENDESPDPGSAAREAPVSPNEVRISLLFLFAPQSMEGPLLLLTARVSANMQ